jgi:type IV secretory pathway VirB2 component (pilin)
MTTLRTPFENSRSAAMNVGLATAGLIAVFLPEIVMAQNNSPMGDAMCGLADFMDGNAGQAVATVGVIALAFLATLGKISWGVCLMCGAGIGAIFSALPLIAGLGVGARGC